MSTAMKATFVVSLIALFTFSAPQAVRCAEETLKPVTRVDFARVDVKGGRLIVKAQGAAHSKRGARLVLHKTHELNKDGLLEYDFCYVPSAKDGDKLKSVIVTLKESSTFVGLKGVRIYTQYNELNALLTESKKKERAPKRGDNILEKKEPEVRKEQPVAKKEQPAPKTQVTPVTTKTPPPKKEQATKKEEAAPKKEEAKTEAKKKSRWRVLNPLNWNPFHRKQAEPEQ